jgi:hypothetical protein
MKKIAVAILLTTMIGITFTGCNEAERVSSNISKEADNFNVVRELTVINNFSDTVVFQMVGNLSITEDGSQLEITVKEDENTYKKHFVGMSQFTTYVLEDVTGSDVSTSKYTLNFNPDMILPINAKNYSEGE